MSGTAWDDGGVWDDGGLWDFTQPTIPYSTAYYQELLTSEYNQQPDCLTVVDISVQPFSDTILLLQSLPEFFNLPAAVGDQLTKLGNLAGVSRYVELPITGVYFSLDSAVLGLDQGVMQGEFDPSGALTALPDDIYLALVQSQIWLNRWDGSIPSLYVGLSFLLNGLVIQDFGNNTMFYGLTTTQAIPLLTQLFLDGYFNLAPAGVAVLPPVITSPNGTPFFGLDAANSAIAGLDTGYMA